MTTLRQKLEQWAEREAKSHGDLISEETGKKYGHDNLAELNFKAGASQLIPMIVKLTDAIEKVCNSVKASDLHKLRGSELATDSLWGLQDALAELEKFLEGK